MWYDQCKCCGVEYFGNDVDFVVFDWCYVVFDQLVGDVVIDQYIGGIKQERNCGYKFGIFQIEVICCLQVVWQSGQIQLCGIIDVVEVEYYFLYGFVFKQVVLFGKVQWVVVNVDVFGVKVCLFIGGEGEIFLVVIKYILVDSDKDFQYVDSDKYLVLVYYQYYCGKDWWVDCDIDC